MKLKKYTEEQLKSAVKNNLSYRKVLQELNVEAYGGNYEVLKRAISYYHIVNQLRNRQIVGRKQLDKSFYSPKVVGATGLCRLRYTLTVAIAVCLPL
jgi:hypothetical protein